MIDIVIHTYLLVNNTKTDLHIVNFLFFVMFCSMSYTRTVYKKDAIINHQKGYLGTNWDMWQAAARVYVATDNLLFDSTFYYNTTDAYLRFTFGIRRSKH